MFTWIDDAKVTAYSVDWDDTLKDYVLTLTGTGFGALATASNTDVYIDEIE